MNSRESEKRISLNRDWFSKNDFSYLEEDRDNIVRIKKVTDIFSQIMNKSSKTLLDLGCGNGFVSKKLAKMGYRTVALDISEENLELTRETGIQTIVGDVNNKLPFDDSSFDLVFAGEIIEHVEDVSRFVGEMYRVLKPEGRLVITTPNLVHLPDRFKFILGKAPSQTQPNHEFLKLHIHPFTKDTLYQTLESSGFKDIKVDSTLVAFLRDKTNSNIVKLKSELLAKVFPGLGSTLIASAKKDINKKPGMIFWWNKLICNLNCNHCLIGKNTSLNKEKNHLSLEEKKEIIIKLKKWLNKPYKMSIIAGEPFLHDDTLEFVKFASENGANVVLTSNGTLICSEKRAREIVESKLKSIVLSLDGISDKVHDESRGRKGVKDAVLKTIGYLKSAKAELKSDYPSIFVNCIIMKDNLGEVPKLIEWAREEKLDGITFQPLASISFFGKEGKFDELWFKKNKHWPGRNAVFKVIDQIIGYKEKGYPIKNTFEDLEGFKNYFTNPVKFGASSVCRSGIDSMTIDEYGFVKMCPSKAESLGVAIKDDLDQIWNSSEARASRFFCKNCKSQCKILANNKDDLYLEDYV